MLFKVCGLIALTSVSVGAEDSQLTLKKVLVSVELSCASCAQGLERRLLRLPEINEIEIRQTEGEIALKARSEMNIDLQKVQDTIGNAGFIPDSFDVTGIGRVITRDAVAGITFGDSSFFELEEGRYTDQLLQADAAQSFLITGRVVTETLDRIDVFRVKRFY